MNSHLQFDFTVNKENNTIVVKRDFAANLEMVWKAWTDPEILDLWWAPKPFQTKQNLWILELEVIGYMPWYHLKERSIGVGLITKK